MEGTAMKKIHFDHIKFISIIILIYLTLFLLILFKNMSINFEGRFNYYYYFFSYSMIGFLICLLLQFSSKVILTKSFRITIGLIILLQYLLTTKVTSIFYDYSQLILILYGCFFYLLLSSIIKIYKSTAAED